MSKYQEEIISYIKEIKSNKAKIGVFTIGHGFYFPQFPGLKNRLIKHFNYFIDRLKELTNMDIIYYEGMCQDYKTANEAGKFFLDKPVDLMICFSSTYAPGVCATAVVNKINAPILLVLLQPSPGMDIKKATTELQLENDAITSLPEISYSIKRMNKKLLDVVTGMLYEDKKAWDKIIDWCDVANVCNKLKNDHIGLMGHPYEGMIDMNVDPNFFDCVFGMHVEHLEMEDLETLVNSVTEDDLKYKMKEIKTKFNMTNTKIDPITSIVNDEDLVWPSKVSVGMDKLAMNYELSGLAYYYRGMDNLFERLHSGMIIGNSLLTTKGIAIAGEYDLKNVVAMLMTDRLNAGGSFTEIHPINFSEEYVMIGHDGPHHIGIAHDKPILRNLKLFHGKKGSGPSVEYKVKEGPITILALTQKSDGKFKMIVAEGNSASGPIPATGNTNTRAIFKPDVRTFLERWSLEAPTHHFSLGIGHIGYKFGMIAKYFNIDFSTATNIFSPHRTYIEK